MQNNEQEVQRLIKKLRAFIHSVDIESHENEILQAVLETPDCEDLQNVSLSLAECHVIDCIERNQLINATGIAQKLNITKGGISKITARLVRKNMIEIQRLANNQKETYYTLTHLGAKVFRLHEILHKQAEERFLKVFSAYNPAELAVIAKFLDGLNTALSSADADKDG